MAKSNSVSLSLWAPPGDLPKSVDYIASKAEAKWLNEMRSRGGIAHILRSRSIQCVAFAARLLVLLRGVYLRNQQIDVLHLNWLQNALPLLATTTPAVISVLGTDFALLRLPGITSMLRMVLRRRKCIIAPNAEWMVDELSRRFGDVARVHPIAFGVDSRWFKMIREPQTDGIRKWVVVSRVTEKKIGPLFSWGEEVFKNGDELHLFGPLQERLTIPSWVKHHGPVHPSQLMDYWFPRAAGLVTLSDHSEGRPQVILEAMAAGLPVVASDISAHRNIFSHRETGWLAGSKEEFRAGVGWLSDWENNASVGGAARKWAEHHIGTWSDCAQRYLNTYYSVLGSNN